MKEIFLIGLGNPGKKYSKSRHNIGFLLLENFSKKYNSNFLLKISLKVPAQNFKSIILISGYFYQIRS